MNTAKIYQDSEGNQCSIHQMVKREQHWAANRIQVGEVAIKRVKELEAGIVEVQKMVDDRSAMQTIGLMMLGPISRKIKQLLQTEPKK